MITVNKMKTKIKGFTLIEFLVVLAIISLLAAMVLIAFNASRNKSRDAAVKSLMAQIRNIGDIYYTSQTPNTYVGLDSGNDIASIETDVKKNNGSVNLTHPTPLSATVYCFQSPINTGGYWCVDSTGYRGFPTAQNTCVNTGACR